MRYDYGYSEEKHLGKPYDLQLLRRLWPLISAYRRLLLGSVLLVTAITALELAIPYFTKAAIDGYIVPPQEKAASSRSLTVDGDDPEVRGIVDRYPDLFYSENGAWRIAYPDLRRLPTGDRILLRRNDIDGLTQVVLLFLAVVMVDFIFTFLQRMIMEYTGHRIMHDLRLKLFDHIQQQAMVFFTHQPVARLVTRVTNDVQNMHELFTTFIAMVFKDMFLLLGIAGVLLFLDWRLALAGFAVLPVMIWTSRRFASRVRKVFREQRIQVARINTRMAESIEGIQTVQAFCREAANAERFAALNAQYYRLGMRQIHIFAVFMPVIEMLGIVAIGVLIFYGGLHVAATRISLGALVAAISYMRMFFRPLRELAENYNVLQNAMASAERIFALLDTAQQLPVVSEAVPRDVAAGKAGPAGGLVFEEVSFAYNPGEPILKKVSFRVSPGQTVALVGPTGAGKTSVLNLILRLYDPDSGQIRLDGRPLPRWSPVELRTFMALVPQEPVLFSGTVRQNIFAHPDQVSPERADRIVDAARCSELVGRLPRGLDTPLEKGGGSLSSGERQLLAIARAMAREPRIILLDEATSYIDSQTEAAIHQALDNLMAGRTCIIVAHRLSTARTADDIVVIQDGCVAEQGGHERLLSARGLYWKLHRQAQIVHPG